MLATRRTKCELPRERISQLIQNCSTGFDEVEFCWHGGEPLLVGIDFYRLVIKEQERIATNQRVVFKNTIQTNGILLNDEWLQFFKKKKFHIGLSFDAPSEVHLVQRPLATGKAVLNDYLMIFKKLKEYKFAPGALCVITENNVNRAEEIFAFYNSIGVTSFSFLPLTKTSRPTCPNPPSNEDLFNLYKETFEMWIGTPNNFFTIEPLETMIRSLMGQYPASCSFGQSCLKRMISITPEGYVVPCSSLVSDGFRLGNIFDSSLLKAISSNRAVQLRRIRSLGTLRNCKGCEFISICRGGCRNSAFCDTGSYDGKFPYCEARKKILKYLQCRLNKILSMAKLK